MAALPLICKVSACIRFCFLARLGLAFPLPRWRCLTSTSVIVVIGFMNRATEVLKERKGSRGYQGWTDWMPHAHWYGISLACVANLGYPTCVVCTRVPPDPLAPLSQLLLPVSSLCRHQESRCLELWVLPTVLPSACKAARCFLSCNYF